MDKVSMTRKKLEEQIKKALKGQKGVKAKIEETPECLHEKMNKLQGMWYQCANKKCKTVFYLFGSVAYRKDALEQELKNVIKKAK